MVAHDSGSSSAPSVADVVVTRSRRFAVPISGVGSRGRRALPSSSTTRRGRPGTAAPCLVRCQSVPPGARPAVRDPCAPWPACSSMRSAIRSISASTSSSVAAISSCATTARSARSARTASVGAAAHAVDELLLVLAGGREVLRDRHARPCSSSRWTRSCRRRSISCSTSGSGTSMATSCGGGLEHLLPHRHLGLHLAVQVEAGADVVAQRLDGVELADLARPTRRWARAAPCFLASFTRTWNATSSPARSPKRSGSVVVELEDVAGALAAQLLVELRHDDPGADLVEVVGGGEPVDRLAVDRSP